MPAPDSAHALRSLVRERLAAETHLVPRRAEGALRLPLIYPSPYHVGMSSLGYQVVYRLLNDLSRPSPLAPGLRAELAAERAFLPDDVAAFRRARLPLTTYESGAAVGQAPALFFSVAYELELTGLFDCLDLSSVPLLREDRDADDPLVICGGPLTFSNPLPLGPFADVVVLGEAEATLPRLLQHLWDAGFAHGDATARAALLTALAHEPGLWIPAVHGERLPPVGRADDADLPACSAILTPNTELRDMFLVEPERGCSRGCTYCVMRRSTNGGMRLVPPERVIDLLPPGVTRVGLVGAAVTDHPRLPQILREIVDVRGLEVGISSLRADRLTDELVGLLARGGYRTLTVASDGPSERLRAVIERKTYERHLLKAAELSKVHGMKVYKVYMMLGLPGETDEDIDELARFTRELSKINKVALGIAPFVAKRNTPLDGAPFAGVKLVEQRLARLRKALGAAAEVRPTSARWAYVEYLLAQGGMDAGRRALRAHRAGGGFAAWQQAFSGWADERRALRVVA